MDRRGGLMGHMVVGLDQDAGWTKMIQSKVVDGWVHLTGEVVLMGSILVLVQRDIIVITTIVLIRGVRSSVFQRSSRKSTLLHLMER